MLILNKFLTFYFMVLEFHLGLWVGPCHRKLPCCNLFMNPSSYDTSIYFHILDKIKNLNLGCSMLCNIDVIDSSVDHIMNIIFMFNIYGLLY